MYLGGIFTVIFLLFWGSFLSPVGAIVIGFIFLLPGGIDGITQLIEIRESTNALRSVTGLSLGAGVVLLINGFAHTMVVYIL